VIALVRWARTNPQDWQAIDLLPTGPQSRLWRNLPKKPAPSAGGTLDDQPGHVFSVCVQGVDLFGFDRVALQPMLNGGIRAYGWVDDTTDPTFKYRWGEVWEFSPGWVDRSISGVRHQGPDHRKTVYAEDLDDMRQYIPAECGGLPVALLPWAMWMMPAAAITRHGIWVRPDDLWRRHFEVCRSVDWREWV
jgi:hypothetical protein